MSYVHLPCYEGYDSYLIWLGQDTVSIYQLCSRIIYSIFWFYWRIYVLILYRSASLDQEKIISMYSSELSEYIKTFYKLCFGYIYIFIRWRVVTASCPPACSLHQWPLARGSPCHTTAAVGMLHIQPGTARRWEYLMFDNYHLIWNMTLKVGTVQLYNERPEFLV